MGYEATFDLVPQYLKAQSPELLRAAMLELNLKMNAFVRYQDIQELKDGSWICWYYAKDDLLNKVVDIVKKQRLEKSK